ncbi:MAG: hypothetical protein AAB225_16400 [Acidobacteriota bacterium]
MADQSSRLRLALLRLLADYRRQLAALIKLHRQILLAINRLERTLLLPPPPAARQRRK